jgi:hypothetical protein
VPHTDALLFIASRLTGWALGKMANKAGVRMRPPPPTMESKKPAAIEAIETSAKAPKSSKLIVFAS